MRKSHGEVDTYIHVFHGQIRGKTVTVKSYVTCTWLGARGGGLRMREKLDLLNKIRDLIIY